MSSEIVIQVENVSKTYSVWSSPAARLHGPLLGQVGQLPFVPAPAREWCRRRSHQAFRNFHALQGVSFQVRRGESFGIIGRNGSGKSTLLQIIAGTLMPTEGSVAVHGSVAALLELGSGFNPEFTGRENVYLSASIRGLSRGETDAKFEEIAAFADIGEFMDQPTKTYSSGMMVRLAFAVSVCVVPDLLIVDEALSVGDVFFQQKCFQRIRALIEAGTTLLFVSHDTSAVSNLCKHAVWLDQGRVREHGLAESVVRMYLAKAGPGLVGRGSTTSQESAGSGALEIPARASVDFSNRERFGDQQLFLASLWIGEDNSAQVRVGEWLDLTLLLETQRAMTDVSAGFELRDRLGQVVYGCGLRSLGRLIETLATGERRLVRFRFQCLLAPGKYTLDVGCGDSNETDNSSDRVAGVAVVTVLPPADGKIVHGLVNLPTTSQVSDAVVDGKVGA